MEATYLRENILESINKLPIEMLEELYKFISFLEYKSLLDSSNNKEEILKNFKNALEEIQRIKRGELKPKDADEFLNEL
jgi:translation elongation factor EF-Ts